MLVGASKNETAKDLVGAGNHWNVCIGEDTMKSAASPSKTNDITY